MQLIPALDLLGDDAVRLERGDFERVLFRRPLEDFIARLVENAPCLVHVVDLAGARDGAIRLDVIERCRALARGIALQVSGGIRSLDVAQEVLRTGVARVVLGTALWRGDDLGTYVEALGDQLVVAIDVREGRLATRGWRGTVPLSVDDALRKCVDAGVARLHVTAIERDGTMSGPDLELYRTVVASGIPVVAAGGIRDDDDLSALEALGCEAAIMGVGYLARLGISLSE